MWTGPDIISREITVQHVRDVNSVLQRKVFIWDNVRLCQPLPLPLLSRPIQC
jgi:hypothetical protein